MNMYTLLHQHNNMLLRWTINLALDTFSKMVCVKSFIDSEDLNEVHVGTHVCEVMPTYMYMSTMNVHV